ncbi:GH15 family glucan-1,4-alpha-glucosidase [Pseudoclavibacter chungangensis]|uniref:glycoside hydrolase family 15 protein n=1 Tax=Pseudoclavibacter chungangensis TaxID=587635 RepID=UPI00185C14C3|nr:GH15 family glucan-1,4-alpha-glucosidase [Pseudoclavibacter chungangensis]
MLSWFASHEQVPAPIEVDAELDEVRTDWQRWIRQASVPAGHEREVRRSLATLRALTFRDTGGIVAAATTSLPERIGAGRNWDYRYVWLRDASLTLGTLLHHGLTHEAIRWRAWLLRAVAGAPADVRIVYGLAGERDLHEREIDSLPGYRGSGPVRIGNGAASQYQADVFGELFIALRAARRHGLAEDGWSCNLQRAIPVYLERSWRRPDRGMWEVRGAPRAFTCSRAMLWAAFQCGVEAVEGGLDGPAERWASVRDELRAEIERDGVDRRSGSFVQFYGGTAVDANLLLLADIGFVAPDDPRMIATVRRIETELMPDGLVLRYDASAELDGIAGGEHPFLACSFWLVEQYARTGRRAEAESLMRRVLACAGDVGQLSEEYDVAAGRQTGNTPQAFTHLALIRAADTLADPLATLADRAPRPGAG